MSSKLGFIRYWKRCRARKFFDGCAEDEHFTTVSQEHIKYMVRLAWEAGRKWGEMYDHHSYCHTQQEARMLATRRALKEAADEHWTALWDAMWKESEDV